MMLRCEVDDEIVNQSVVKMRKIIIISADNKTEVHRICPEVFCLLTSEQFPSVGAQEGLEK